VAYLVFGAIIITVMLTLLYISGIATIISGFIFSSLKFFPASTGGQIFNQEALKDAKPLVISMKSIEAKPVDNKSAILQLFFDVYNPNKSTVMLESISYNVYSNSGRIVSGDIGEKPEGFVGSQANIFPIVGNMSSAIGDKEIISRDGPRETNWKSIIDGSERYGINGTFSYKQTSSFQSSGGDSNFSLKFP
jgi:hypothetical protein